jgi:hypothetical protein
MAVEMVGDGVESSLESVDFISKLPLEISQFILRKLDPESLLTAPQISRKWLEVCSSDWYLRSTARDHLKEKKESSMPKPNKGITILHVVPYRYDCRIERARNKAQLMNKPEVRQSLKRKAKKSPIAKRMNTIRI